MLSLPYIVPRDDLWSTTSFRPNITSSSEFSNDPHRQHMNHARQSHNQHFHHHHHHHHAHHQHSGHSGPQNASHASASSSSLSFRSLTHTHASRASIDHLILEERAIEQRKLNVRRFGAGWLRPPGVAKTFQARLDEDQERREQLEIARREAQMAELAAASAAAANANAPNVNAVAGGLDMGGQEQVEPVVGGGVGDGGEGDGMEERDLDADVPDADALASESDEDDDDEDDEDEEDTTDNITEGNITRAQEDETEADEEGNITIEPSRFGGEESMLEGSLVGGADFSPARAERYVDAEDAELDGRAQDMRDLGVEPDLVDLDADIPEAGSYEHTDTEEEDSDSEDEDDSRPVIEQSFANLPSSASRNVDLSVLDDETVDEMLDSSFVSLPRHRAGNATTSNSNHGRNVREARRNRRSMAGATARGRWSGGSDVAMTNSDAEPSPSLLRSGSSNGSSSMMARLRAARRNG